ncbi:hypothetical protein EC912_101694 [Luteibacter rhizovicinus]|uniref:Uncharacterized protein n=1 Tax=Luteibacter rhizovicinus TaxID=242606 RepID=A0A4R3YWY6_9GAMM|nr:hypothetical protein [Luteibacter rhizovicinus]TCV97677.1 hypothetical protein EC912_101694 [Luteibacter rhizovicinus]
MKNPMESHASPDDALDVLLRKALADELNVSADEGFTDRVVSHLPARRIHRSRWSIAPYVGAIAGGTIFTLCAPDFRDTVSQLVHATPDHISGMALLVPLLPLILTGLVISGLTMLDRR